MISYTTYYILLFPLQYLRMEHLRHQKYKKQLENNVPTTDMAKFEKKNLVSLVN